MFLTTYYNTFIYVYKYACLVKLKYLQYLVNWTYTAVLQVKFPVVRDSRAGFRGLNFYRRLHY